MQTENEQILKWITVVCVLLKLMLISSYSLIQYERFKFKQLIV